MRGLSSPRSLVSPPVPGALRASPRRIAFAMRDLRQRHAPLSLRIGSDCSWPGRLCLKIEINIHENFPVLDLTRRPIPVDSRWYSGGADIATFELDRLPATTMRARYQCRKGRDLFDLAMELATRRSDARRIVDVFGEYTNREGDPVTRTMFDQNLAGKIHNTQFHADMRTLLRRGFE